MRRLSVCLTFLLLLTAGRLSAQERVMPPLDRAKLPEAARNLPLDRLSSGALMLLNNDDMLVAPRPLSAKGATAARAEENAPVALDLRIGANIRLGNDPPQLPATMRAQAEPHIARSLSTQDWLVATFQEGRFATDGGAVDVGFSTSHDGGLTWTRTLLPNLTQAAGGPYYRATDPVVAFDAANSVYITTDAATDATFANGVITVSKSSNGGASFAAPAVVYRPPDNSVFPDKEWIAVNSSAGTPHFGRVVVTWTLFSNTKQNVNPIVLSYSDNGGANFSPVRNVTAPGTSVQGSQP
ncbi:MAG: sialidase family protein, partial [Verrucomicrobiota bacterium]